MLDGIRTIRVKQRWNPHSRLLIERSAMREGEGRRKVRSLFHAGNRRGEPATPAVYFPRARIERASACARREEGDAKRIE